MKAKGWFHIQAKGMTWSLDMWVRPLWGMVDILKDLKDMQDALGFCRDYRVTDHRGKTMATWSC